MFSIFQLAIKFDCLFLALFKVFTDLRVLFLTNYSFPPLPQINTLKDDLNHF